MAAIVPLNYIEITQDRSGNNVARVAGTRIRVSEIVRMYRNSDASIDWIVENFEVLDRAKVHAALAYYYDHQQEIEAEINQPVEVPADAVTLEQIKARIKARQSGKTE